MNRRYRSRIATIGRTGAVTLAVVAGLTACGSGSDTPSGSSTGPSLLVGRTFISDDASDAQIPGGGPLVISFGSDDRISASAGCNMQGAHVEFVGDTLTAGPLMGTMMACPPPRDGADRWLRDLFDAPLTWSLDGRRLTLVDGDRTVRLDQRVARAVAGTTWRVRALIARDAVTSSRALDEAAPTLTIGADGTLRGSTGCNTMTGQALVVGSAPEQTIEFGDVETTDDACSGEAADIERAVLAVLRGSATATVDGDRMRLMNVDDPTIGLELSANRTSSGG